MRGVFAYINIYIFKKKKGLDLCTVLHTKSQRGLLSPSLPVLTTEVGGAERAEQSALERTALTEV